MNLIVLMLFLFPLLLESPRYLAQKGKLEAAEAILKKVAKLNNKSLPPGRLAANKGASDNKHMQNYIVPAKGFNKIKITLNNLLDEVKM